MTNLIGQSLGRYHILEQLGEGGMAIVYKAYDTRLERDVAIKVIRVEQFGKAALEGILKRFDREAKALAKLSHANIIGVIDYGEQDGNPYLVMEYLPGGTLKKKLGQPIPWQDALRLLIPIARALDYAHRQGMVHRDVKPSNIITTADGDPMLTDFGISKILEGSETHTLTITGAAMGTPEYMAPEQWIGTVSPRSDIYSLGVILYEMVTGRKPYTADTPAAILLKQTNEPLPRPRQFVPDLPDAVEKVLLKALAKQPEDRYQDMGGLASVMEALLSGEEHTVAIAMAKEVTSDSDTRINDVTWNNNVQGKQKEPPVAEEKQLKVTPQPKRRWIGCAVAAGVVIIVLGVLLGIFGGKIQARLFPTQTPAATNTLIPTFTRVNTVAPLPTPMPEPLPGKVVVPLDTLGKEIPWLPMDKTAIPGINYVGFNTVEPPFNNPLVRQAFAYSIDRNVLVDMAIRFGEKNATPATTLTPPQTLGRDLYGVVGVNFDPGRAKELLKEAGYSDVLSFPRVIFLIRSSGTTDLDAHFNMAKTMADMWQVHLGIRVEIQFIKSFSDYNNRLKTDPPGLFWVSWVADYNDPANFVGEIFNPNGNYHGEYNYGSFSNSEFNRLVDLAAGRNDPGQRQALYIHAEDILCKIEAAIIPLFHATYNTP
jgi:serine/threonine protein kinase